MRATRGTTRVSFAWAAALVETLVVAGLIPLAFDPRAYFCSPRWYHQPR